MKKLGLSAKIIILIAFFVASCFAITAVSIFNMKRMETSTEHITKFIDKRIISYLDLSRISRESTIQQKNLLLATSKEERSKVIDRMENVDKAFDISLKDAMALSSDEGKKRLENITKIREKLGDSTAQLEEALLKNNLTLTHDISTGDQAKLSRELDDTLDNAIEAEQRNSEDELSKSDKMMIKSRWILLLVTGITTLSSLFVGFRMVLTMKNVNQSTSNVISKLNQNSVALSQASSSITTLSDSLARESTNQAASLQETVSAVEEIASMIERNPEHSNQVAQNSSASKETAEKGKAAVNEMISSMEQISDGNAKMSMQIEESNRKISEIVSMISEIGQKTKIINDIVFQTKLLSFNASVEAARAGEHGKGFSVVAEEVGNLAQMSGNAAKEISVLLDNSMKNVKEIVAETKSEISKLSAEGIERVEKGVKIANLCGNMLDQIVENISGVVVTANDIASASQEQSNGIREISKAMAHLDMVTQTNATTSQNTANAAKEINNQAESMRSAVNVLAETILGANPS